MRMKKEKATAAPIDGQRYDAAAEKDENIVGMRIAEARKKKGMSIAAFSAFLKNYGVEISTGGAGKWETGYSITSGQR